MATTTETTCTTVDKAVKWTEQDGTLNVEVGDLVIDDGQLEQIARLFWDRETNVNVGVLYESQSGKTGDEGSPHPRHRESWVTVLRYVETPAA